MTEPLASITLVAVIDRDVPDAATLARHAEALATCAIDVDLVLVANGVDAATALALKCLVAETPDCMAVFLAEPVHDDLARLVGIEHAVSDHVLFLDPRHDDPADLPALLAPLRDGYDLVVGERAAEPPARGPVERVLIALYRRLYTASTGVPLTLEPTGLRVLSRAAALHVAGRPQAELLLRATTIGTGFPAITVTLPPRATPARAGLHHSWSKGIGLLLSASAMPLRGASYAALLGGGASLLYSAYVVAVYLLKPDVAAGWTTLSLQLAGMMFIFSVVLLFLSEYVIQIHAASAPRSRRHLVVRELRSPLSRRTGRLNLVDAEGKFHLGKPAWLETREGQGA